MAQAMSTLRRARTITTPPSCPNKLTITNTVAKNCNYKCKCIIDKCAEGDNQILTYFSTSPTQVHVFSLIVPLKPHS